VRPEKRDREEGDLADRIDNPAKGGSCLYFEGSLKVLVPIAMAELLMLEAISVTSSCWDKGIMIYMI
jgi:hypothetical protein